jgi:uridylate kinase
LIDPYAAFFLAANVPTRQNAAPTIKRMGNEPSPVLGETVPPAVLVVPAVDAGVELAIVIGGGNFWRGRTSTAIGRVQADQIGMLATVMNCLYVSEIFRGAGLDTRVMTSFAVGTFTEQFSKDQAVRYLEDGVIVFFAGGTGHPYFSTDTGIVLRAVETEADMILMAKNVDGVYDSDPAKNPDAKRFDHLTYEEVVERNLQAVDMTSSVLAKENGMEMRIFALQAERSIIRAAEGDFDGTTITA